MELMNDPQVNDVERKTDLRAFSSLDMGYQSSAGSWFEAGEDETEGQAAAIIAKAETKAVRRLKFLVFVVLLASMIGVSLSMFLNTRNSENKNFEVQFDEYAIKVFESLGTSVDLTLGAVDSLVVNVVSYARATNQTWPFVTVPDFAVRGAKIRSLSNAVFLTVYPYVTATQRPAWEKYSSEHNQWVDEGISVQEEDENYEGPIIKEYESFNVIHYYDEFDKENPGVEGTDRVGPYYLPTWQSVPVIPRYPVYNWDLASAVSTESFDSVIKTGQVSISEAYLINVTGDEAKNEENVAEAEFFADYISPSEAAMRPLSDFYYPIISSSVDAISTNNKPGSQVLGILALSVYWRDTIRNILPDGANGIDVVFDNVCSPSFTYRINGPAVEFLGSGDLHEKRFDRYGRKSMLKDLKNYFIGNRVYTGAPLNENYCPHYISVYPSSVMHNDFTTSNPMVFAVAAILIFSFTSAVFVLYDLWVERRQKLVLSSATRSNAIVSSLFPSNVRDKLLEEQIEAPEPAGLLKSYLTGEKETDGHVMIDSKPIANLYPDATVFFADICGFTSWSSTRDPPMIFVLLEAVYGAFDDLAMKEKVYKIETIGDCYVAVTGLPEPNKHHAVAMARFAAAARDAMNELTTDLEPQLGPGTADLRLRLGMHSGSVTAGVLRGSKSRFQLFGDTVNTAARMESTGQSDRIQVSQATADLLVAAGKSRWLTKREDLVEAKGKGKMQTYWVEPNRRKRKENDVDDSPGIDLLQSGGSPESNGVNCLGDENLKEKESSTNPSTLAIASNTRSVSGDDDVQKCDLVGEELSTSSAHA